MLATLIIVFREALEAALVIGIVAAASRGLRRRGMWIAAGCGAGALGAILVAWFAGALASSLDGVGQEVFDASVLLAAVMMLGWHNVWMSRHGRQLAADAARLGREVGAGTRTRYAISVVCGIAVLREGSEVVLFLYGIAATGGGGGMGMLSGGVLGLAAGAAVGVAIYYGLLAVPLRHLFGVTSWLVLLLAAGMASQAAAFLSAANILPSLGNNIWDTSSVLPDRNLVGQLLHVLVGYSARPAGIQLVFYAAALIVIGLGMRMFGVSAGRRREVAPAE